MESKKILKDERLEKIISQVEKEMSVSSAEYLDTEIWDVPRNYIWPSLFLQDSTNNYENLRNYTQDMLKAHGYEIEFKQKYTNKVYHQNTWRWLELMNTSFSKIVEKLDQN